MARTREALTEDGIVPFQYIFPWVPIAYVDEVAIAWINMRTGCISHRPKFRADGLEVE
jgi:hypothetical protein